VLDRARARLLAREQLPEKCLGVVDLAVVSEQKHDFTEGSRLFSG